MSDNVGLCVGGLRGRSNVSERKLQPFQTILSLTLVDFKSDIRWKTGGTSCDVKVSDVFGALISSKQLHLSKSRE